MILQLKPLIFWLIFFLIAGPKDLRGRLFHGVVEFLVWLGLVEYK